jgi:tRNA (mo5U34)-methyltransferase
MPRPWTADELKIQVSAVPFWWHSLDLGEGIVTPGRKTPEILRDQLAQCQLPDLHGRTVLDIGAWDGFFSFHAERMGAARVVALDHFVWSIDFTRVQGSRRPEETPDAWRPQELPGKRGFDVAHRALASRVETVVADFMEMDLAALGTFDVVLYLGVLYHQRHPLLALERLAQVTRELAVIETEAIAMPGFEDRAFCQFFETDELAGDPTNWWSPNAEALLGMCRAAGFRKVVLQQAKTLGRFQGWRKRCKALLGWGPRADAGLVRQRLTVHAYK